MRCTLRGGRIAAHFGDRAGEAQHQVERVDALRDQHAAAVARLGAAAARRRSSSAGRHSRIAVEQLTIRPSSPARSISRSFMPAGRKRCCSMTPSVTPASVGSLDQVRRASGRNLQRLFQQNVLAGRRAFLDQIEMRVRRREDLRRSRRFCRRGSRRGSSASGKGNLLGERLAPRRARAEGSGDLDAVLQVDQALGMRRHRQVGA